MKSFALLALASLISGCGPDRNLLMETKFDAGLRQRVTVLSTEGRVEDLTLIGRCTEPINGAIRQQLIDAGADVLSMNGPLFTARIPSDEVFSLAGLECVSQVQLSQAVNPNMP